MKRFEYCQDYPHLSLAQLNKLGAEGWELIHIETQDRDDETWRLYTFKRELAWSVSVGHTVDPTIAEVVNKSRTAQSHFRVVRGDNYDRSGEQPGCDERFVTEPLSEEDAVKYAEDKNSKQGPHSDYFYRVVPANYELKKFEP